MKSKNTKLAISGVLKFPKRHVPNSYRLLNRVLEYSRLEKQTVDLEHIMYIGLSVYRRIGEGQSEARSVARGISQGCSLSLGLWVGKFPDISRNLFQSFRKFPESLKKFPTSTLYRRKYLKHQSTQPHIFSFIHYKTGQNFYCHSYCRGYIG